MSETERSIPMRVLELAHAAEKAQTKEPHAVFTAYSKEAAPLMARALLAVFHKCDDVAPGAETIRRGGEKARQEFAREIRVAIIEALSLELVGR